MRKIIAAVAITWAIVFSVRIVTIATPLNILEQIALIGTMFEYTLFKSRRLEDDTDTTTKK